MELKFYHRWYGNTLNNGFLPAATTNEPIDEEWERIWQAEWKKDAPNEALTSAMSREYAFTRPYSKYLACALETDFPAHHPDDVDKVLSEIEKLERGEIDIAYWGGDPGFEQTITREGVTFEHGTFGECLEWPLWSCSLAQYKAALQGWRQFIDMPNSIDSELIVELPEDNSSIFPHS